MAGFENNVMVAQNMNFDTVAAKPHLGVINAAGKFPIGTGLSFPSAEILGGKIISPLGTVTVGYSSPNITLEVAAGGFLWNDVSGAFSPLKENGYFVTGTATGTLPAAPAQGDTIKFFVDTTQILTIQASGTQIIRLGSAVTAAAGTAVSTARGDSVELTYRASDTCWCAIAGFSGIWVVT